MSADFLDGWLFGVIVATLGYVILNLERHHHHHRDDDGKLD
jgi:hypothetical protein